jgi:hypothetical protein
MKGLGTIIASCYFELARLAWNRDPSRAISGEVVLGSFGDFRMMSFKRP